MSSMTEARKLLAELPEDDALKALEEITSWLTSITDTPGFSADLRSNLIKLLDETGQPFHADLLKKYLASPHSQDFQGMQHWHGVHRFFRALAQAYEESIAAIQREKLKPYEIQEKMPLLCVRLLRAAAEQMKLELMRYIDIEQTTWARAFNCYSIAETCQIDGAMLVAYPGHAIHTSPQYELLRILVLHESAPGNLSPNQIEVAFRIAGRMASFFDLTLEKDVNSEYCIDLAQPHPPKVVNSAITATPTMRYFSALRALPRVIEIIKQHERDAIDKERRFGSEFTPEGKLTVLKHLLVYWDKNHPHRLLERRGISTNIEVVHSFRTISKLVTYIDLGQDHGLSEEDASALNARSKISVMGEGKEGYTSELWTVIDASFGGIGGIIPRAAGAWVKIGDLCGIKAHNAQTWWVGVIRRLHTDQQALMHVGIEILAKKSLSVWLRVLGKGTERVSNWETSSGSFRYDYIPAIILPDAQNSFVNATMLLESGNYVSGNIYEVMMGEKSREIELAGLLYEGEDYELVTFQWLTKASS